MINAAVGIHGRIFSSAPYPRKEGSRTVSKEYFKLLAQNKKAHFEYFLEELLEAGIELKGTEVKSMRMGKCSLKESFIKIENGEAWLYNMHISPYDMGNLFNTDPLRTRRLLLHGAEIRKLSQAVRTDGYTIVPVRAYLSGNRVKIEIALAKGKKLYDKREAIAEKDRRRETERDYKNGYR